MSRKKTFIAVAVVLALFVGLRLALHVVKIPQAGMFPSFPPNSVVVCVEYWGAPASIDRGEVVVFTEKRADGDYDFIWRVVGLPGETVEVRDDVVVVDGEPLKQETASREGEFEIRREHAGGRSYLVAIPVGAAAKPAAANHPPTVIPPGSVFLLGDNRHHAHDSRATGPVPLASMKARVWHKLMPLGAE